MYFFKCFISFFRKFSFFRSFIYLQHYILTNSIIYSALHSPPPPPHKYLLSTECVTTWLPLPPLDADRQSLAKSSCQTWQHGTKQGIFFPGNHTSVGPSRRGCKWPSRTGWSFRVSCNFGAFKCGFSEVFFFILMDAQ